MASEQDTAATSQGLETFVDKPTIAYLLGLTATRIDQLLKDGVLEHIKIDGQWRYETVTSIRRYCRYISDRANGKDRSATEAELKAQKLKADIALKESQGELHRLRTDIAQGNYISLEEVKADYSRFFIVFKNFALALPSKMAGRLSGFVEPAEVRAIENELQKEIKSLLDGFVSRALTEGEAKAQEDVLKPKKTGRPRKNATK